MSDDGWRCLGRSSPITSPLPPRKGYASPIFTIIKDPATSPFHSQQSVSRPVTPTTSPLFPSTKIQSNASSLFRREAYSSTPSLTPDSLPRRSEKFSSTHQLAVRSSSRPSSSLASGAIVLQPVRRDFTQQTLPREQSSRKERDTEHLRTTSPKEPKTSRSEKKSSSSRKRSTIVVPKSIGEARKSVSSPVQNRKNPVMTSTSSTKRIETSIVQRSSTRLANRGYTENQYSSTTIRIENDPKRSPIVTRRSESTASERKEEAKQYHQARTSGSVTRRGRLKVRTDTLKILSSLLLSAVTFNGTLRGAIN